MKRPHSPGLRLVAAREWRWLMRDRLAPLLIFGVPLLAFAILVAVFTHPVIRGLRTVVIDDDRTQTSRNLIEVLSASPNLRIAERAEDLVSAVRALRSGDAIAAVHIPANFERDLTAQRRPQVVAFYNQEQLTAAGLAAQGLHDVLLAAAHRIAPANASAPTAPRIGTLAVENIVLVNPERNYAQFLLRSLLPMVLHVVIAVSAGYAVGSEFGRRSMRVWLACAGGNPIVAIAGKLMPLFVVFAVMMMVVALIIEGFFGIAFRGDVVMMVAAAALFIVGLSFAWRVAATVDAQFADRTERYRLDRLAGVRLCRRGISGARHECVLADLRRAAAAALVRIDLVRSGRARHTGRGFGGRVRCARGSRCLVLCACTVPAQRDTDWLATESTRGGGTER